MPQKRRNRKAYGALGEGFAEKLLRKRGYKILRRNFRSKVGEIDIVAKDKDELVFVEVKTRWSRKYGKPEEAVTPYKIARIKRAGEYFLQQNKIDSKKLRIEVVALEISEGKIVRSEVIRYD